MPKSVKNVFYPNLKFKSMMEAYERAAEGKHYVKEVILYKMNLAENIISTLKQLYNHTYIPGEYRKFYISVPKRRLIKSLSFKDRIVQQWYVESFIKPIFIPKFIDDTYACIPKRGVHYAIKKLKRYMYAANIKNPNAYVLKCDISKFFYSIDKDILYSYLQRYIKDKDLLDLTQKYIYDDEEKVGIPIGNYTSQYFANIYLNRFDHYIKEVLKIKYYIRYVDDFVLILENKEEAKRIKRELETYLDVNLHLKLNQKTNYYKIKQGVTFLGYKVFPNYVLIRSQRKKQMYRTIKKYNKLYEKKQLDLRKATLTLKSWKAHMKIADAYNLTMDMTKKCKWLYDGEKEYEEYIEE